QVPVSPPTVSVSSGSDGSVQQPMLAAPLSGDTNEVRPVPVVQVLSPIGVEYVFMTVALFVGAIGLASSLLSLVNGKADFAVLAFPVASLLVSLPVFAYFFLRLKRLE